MKKAGKTTRPFRYDLNQIPYDYTVEVRNRFKGLDLIDRVPDELWTEVRDIVQETGIKTIPCGSDGKASACNAGDLGSIPGSGRFPGEGNGNPLQFSCLENSMDRGAWQAAGHGVAKSRTRLSNFTFFHYYMKYIKMLRSS